MDVNVSIRPVQVAGTAASRSDAVPGVPQAAATDLPAASTVTPITGSEPIRYDLSDGARRLQAAADALQQAVDRNLVTDPRTSELVLKVVDHQTRQVIEQIPSEAQLRLRAYVRDVLSRQSGAAQATGDKVAKTA